MSDRATPAGELAFDRELAAASLALSDVRAWITAALRERGRAELIDSAVLVGTELVSNAKAASEPAASIGIRFRVAEAWAELAVENAGQWFYQPMEMPAASAARGRGLPIVQAIASDVRSHTIDSRVTVTARVIR